MGAPMGWASMKPVSSGAAALNRVLSHPVPISDFPTSERRSLEPARNCETD